MILRGNVEGVAGAVAVVIGNVDGLAAGDVDQLGEGHRLAESTPVAGEHLPRWLANGHTD